MKTIIKQKNQYKKDFPKPIKFKIGIEKECVKNTDVKIEEKIELNVIEPIVIHKKKYSKEELDNINVDELLSINDILFNIKIVGEQVSKKDFDLYCRDYNLSVNGKERLELEINKKNYGKNL